MVKQYCFERVNILCFVAISMSSDSNKIPDILPDGMRVRSEEIGFAAGELLPCPKCTRPNSPDRGACIYCGSALESSGAAVLKTLDTEVLEVWQNGYSVAVSLKPEAMSSLSGLLGIEKHLLVSISDGCWLFPAARLRSETDAEGFVTNLHKSGLESFVISDASLMTEKPPVRLRSIEFGDSSCAFVEFNTGNRRVIPTGEIRLVVTGELIESRTESKWKKKPKKKDRPDETVIDSDRPVIDVYTSRDDLGYRVQMNGFDFSGLGDAKGMLARENMRMLTVRLKEVATDCRVDTKYHLARPLLDRVWELETETDHLGIFAGSFMSKEKTKVSMMNNQRQFTKYSRLQRLSI